MWRRAVLLWLAAVFGACRAPSPTQLKLGAGQALDSRSFAFDVIFLPGEQVGCALLERGEHRLVSFDRASGRRQFELRLADGQDHLTSLAISPSGRLLAAGFRALRDPKSDSAPIWSSAPEALVAGGMVVLVELHGARARVLRRISVPRPVLALVFMDEQRLGLGTAAANRPEHTCRPTQRECARPPLPGSAGVCLLDTSGQWIGCVTQPQDSVTSQVRLDDRLASGSWDGTVRIWGPRLEQLGTLVVGTPVNALAWAPRAEDGPLLAVGTSREPPRRSRALAALEAAGGNRRERHQADRIELWRLTDRRRVRVLRPHLSYVTELAISPDARLLVSGSWDFSVVLHRGAQRLRLARFSQIVTGLALTPSADALAIAAWTEAGSGAPSCLVLPLR